MERLGCGARGGPEAWARLQYLIGGTTSIVYALGFSGVETSNVKHFLPKAFFFLIAARIPGLEFLVVSLFCAPS